MQLGEKEYAKILVVLPSSSPRFPAFAAPRFVLVSRFVSVPRRIRSRRWPARCRLRGRRVLGFHEADFGVGDLDVELVYHVMLAVKNLVERGFVGVVRTLRYPVRRSRMH